MDLLDAITQRRTLYDFAADPIDDETLCRALDAGRYAQNHKLTNPWRFTIAGPAARRRIADRMIELKSASAAGPRREEMIAKATAKADGLARLPALVIVSQVRTPGDPFREREDYAAVAGAVHLIALALWEQGIGMQWGTGDVTRDPQTYVITGVDPDAEEIVGFLKIGRIPPGAERPAAAPQRKPLADVLRRVP
jgi:nitroreductase